MMMLTSRHAIALVALLLAPMLLLTLAGCGTQTVETSAIPSPASVNPAGPVSLPAPRNLPERHVSFDEAGLLQRGSQNVATLPSNRLTANGQDGDFTPSFTTGSSITGLAYAVYSWNVQGYNRDMNVRLNWSLVPTTGNCFVALANYTTNRWEWHALPAPDLFGTCQIDFSGLADYMNPTTNLMYAAVAVMGTDLATLRCIRVGANPAPTADLQVNNTDGQVPLDVTFDGSGSAAFGGLDIAEYDFDFGDGQGFLSNGAGNSAGFLYTTAGTFNAALRVIDVFGGSAVANVTITTHT